MEVFVQTKRSCAALAAPRNMKKDVIISIRSCPQYEGDQDPETIELITDGKFYRKNGIYYIVYKESALTGLNGLTTTLKVEKDRVVLLRTGETSSQMQFECGEKHVGLYHTDVGVLTVAVNASSIKNTLTDSGGELIVEYTIEINNTLAGENVFSAIVKEAEPYSQDSVS